MRWRPPRGACSTRYARARCGIDAPPPTFEFSQSDSSSRGERVLDIVDGIRILVKVRQKKRASKRSAYYPVA